MTNPGATIRVPISRSGAAPTPLRYALGAGIGVLGALGTAASADFVGNSVFLGPTISTVVAILLVGGFGPAAVAGIIALSAAAVLLLPPAGLAIGSPADQVKVVFALGCVLAATAIDGRSRRERHRLRERQRALADGEWQYRMLLEQASDAILVFSSSMHVELVSARASEMLGRSREALIALSYEELFGEPGAVLRAVTEGNTLTPPLVDLTVARPDGTSFAGELSARGLPDGRAQVILRDVTARKRAADEMRGERDLLDGILDTSAAAILAFEIPSRRVLFANQRLADVCKIPRERLLSRELDIGWEYAELDGSPLSPERMPSARILSTGTMLLNDEFLARPAGDTGWRHMSCSGAPLRGADGRVRALVLAFDDISERAHAKRVAQESEERLRRITDAVPGTVYQLVLAPNGEQRFDFVSAGVRDLLNVSTQVALDNFSEIWSLVAPEDQDRVARSIADSARGLTRWSEEFQVQLASGERKWVRGTSTPEPTLTDGSVRWSGLLLDITERKRLEGDLLQVQKMESIGRLAGGIAHDFNNILTAIRGNVDLLLEEVSEDHEHFPELRDIRDAADRAAALTRQLLAFSRKQAMQTRDLELTTLVRDVEKMLRRVIGEDVVLLTQPSEAVGLVRADPGQLEQVLLNLAVNARDAMPSGGLLTIETRNARVDGALASSLGVPHGDYLTLVVRDTGHGMSAETKLRIFDPFFTTKPAGKGTGLGLAMVYGIVRQSGGAIAVDSEPDRGATFRIYFPRVSRSHERASPVITPTSVSVTARRQANILLVEDDSGVRSLAKRILQDAGFTVRVASDAYEALTVVGVDCADLDLVVSDVIMPGMGGRDMASELRARRHDLRILYISGYLDIDLQKLGLDKHTRLLSKPFTRDSLLRNITLLLDAEPLATVATA